MFLEVNNQLLNTKYKELYNSESDRDDAYTSIRTSLLS
jgi:hypothetical protein